MSISWFRKAASAVALIAVSCSACAQQADFNEVGRQMAIMLQNSHFARLPFNAQLSQRFLDDYLQDLDFQKLYFTQVDVDGFRAKYGEQLHTLLLHGNSMPVATEIYRTFEKRVEERVGHAEKLLKEGGFDFSVNETTTLSRKEAPWPKNDKEAAELWRLQIKEAVLGETLRRELLTKLAKEQGKSDPGAHDRTPTEKISLRYKRFLTSVKDVDDEEIASYFLSSVARSYDPHTDYMSFREMNRFKDGMKNELVGIGALLQSEEDGATKIMGIVVGGPADRESSLKLNDRVVAVDTLNTGKAEDMVDIMFMKIDKVVDYIRGKEGTSVALKVEPSGGAPGETKIVVIQRGKVEMKDEQASGEVIEMKDAGGPVRRMGVITLPSFYADFDEGKVRCSVDVERILSCALKGSLAKWLFCNMIAMRDDVVMVPGDPRQRAAIRVTLVQRETPGERAGLRADDLIVGIGREKWHDPGATVRFRERIAATKPGTTVNLKLLRDGAVVDVPVVLCRRPAGVNQQFFPGGGEDAVRAERDAQDAYFKAWMEERNAAGKMP